MDRTGLKAAVKKIPLLWRCCQLVRRSLAYLAFVSGFLRLRALSRTAGNRFEIRWKDRYPCLDDNTATTGFDRHYIYHPAWAARILADQKPACHVDIGSTLHFATLVSAFVPTRFFDYRPANLELSNLTAKAADLLTLPFADDSIPSLSCMHVVEHVGLGRYGDALDPEGDLKAIAELKRVLAPGGMLLFVIPVGKPKIMFNAHRIYSYRQVTDLFSPLVLEEFALIPDNPEEGGLVRNATGNMADSQTYACGCFLFRNSAC
jgi:hypothetical protein